MQIVIDIDEELYNYMQTEEYNEHLDKRFDYQIRFSIKNGTLLPKRHGRLIDADAVLEEPIGNTYKDIGIAETIIEADRKEQE